MYPGVFGILNFVSLFFLEKNGPAYLRAPLSLEKNGPADLRTPISLKTHGTGTVYVCTPFSRKMVQNIFLILFFNL